MDSDVLALEELDKTIQSLVELRKHLAKKVSQQKQVVSMDDFLEMLLDNGGFDLLSVFQEERM